MMELAILLICFLAMICAFAAVIAFAFKNEIKAIRTYRRLKGHVPECLRCTDCCRKTVTVSSQEVENISAASGMKAAEFVKSTMGIKYLRRDEHGNCIFQDIVNGSSGDKISHCRIYPVRPAACRRFPRLKYWGIPGLDWRCRAVRQTQIENHRTEKDE